MLDRLGRLPQPWLFLALAVGFGIVAYFASGGSVWRGVAGGAAFGLAISAWLRLPELLIRAAFSLLAPSRLSASYCLSSLTDDP